MPNNRAQTAELRKNWFLGKTEDSVNDKRARISRSFSESGSPSNVLSDEQSSASETLASSTEVGLPGIESGSVENSLDSSTIDHDVSTMENDFEDPRYKWRTYDAPEAIIKAHLFRSACQKQINEIIEFMKGQLDPEVFKREARKHTALFAVKASSEMALGVGITAGASIAGAALGTLVFPGVGTGIGAAAGAGIGLAGKTLMKEVSDKAFSKIGGKAKVQKTLYPKTSKIRKSVDKEVFDPYLVAKVLRPLQEIFSAREGGLFVGKKVLQSASSGLAKKGIEVATGFTYAPAFPLVSTLEEVNDYQKAKYTTSAKLNKLDRLLVEIEQLSRLQQNVVSEAFEELDYGVVQLRDTLDVIDVFDGLKKLGVVDETQVLTSASMADTHVSLLELVQFARSLIDQARYPERPHN
ncbi:hypothetical protein [Pseudomonas sp. NFIX28]|uniref:hypothetical protein n=1 Tax=Pseudomonas sp. NFIX28 TaxID=1566235 RepID=UPI0008977DF0|nr:hypothetical protein [Pseudomonas sp. NFIX28]SDY38132.1 hypothetical protein SAMN03159453_00430 [Pseudomonas sp. NFIX28]